ncbi:restriction endonuclease subunit S [Bacillus mobilis]|uniref:restriction endonuclease subunit S n=1 Tax=Bacillus mobilis TaxID=2026190 RepID=UPI003D026436
MQYIKLKNAFKIQKGKKVEQISEYQENCIRCIQIEDLRNNDTLKYCLPNEKHVVVEEEDILIAWDGANAGTVGTGLVGALGSTLAKLTLKTDKLVAPFVAILLQSKFDYFQQTATGATIPHISRKALEDIDLPVIDIEIQKKIVKVINSSLELIKKRQSQIEALDELVQSVFLEMFGDPSTNPKGWCKVTLPQIVEDTKYSIKRGPFGGALKKDIFINQGYLVYEQYHAINDDFSLKRYFIDDEKFEELKAFKVNPGDLIVSCSGVTLGRIAEIPQNALPGIINQALLKITLDSRKMNNVFFKFLFRNRYVQDILFSVSRGSGVPNLPPMSVIKSIEFMCPPINMQKAFEIKINAIQAQKSNLEFTLKEMRNLYNSLLQKAFKGEIFQEQA